MSAPETLPIRIVQWVYDPDTSVITGRVQGDGHSVIIATIPADPPAE